MSKKLHFTLFLKYYDLNFWVLRVFKKKKCSLLVFFFTYFLLLKFGRSIIMI